MSDSASGPGWWQASDSKWYPPEQHPDHRPPPPQPPNLPPPPTPGPPPPPTSTPPPPPFATAAVATPDPPKEKRPIYKEPLFLALVGILAVLTLAAVILGVVSDGGSTSQSGSSPSQTGIVRWHQANPGFSSDIFAGKETLDDMAIAVETLALTGNARFLEAACRDLGSWVLEIDQKYDDYPSPQWLNVLADLGRASMSCIDGDYPETTVHINSATERFGIMAAESP